MNSWNALFDIRKRTVRLGASTVTTSVMIVIKPLDGETIRRTLIALLAMKNKPGNDLLDETGAIDLFQYLQGIGLLEGTDL